MSATDPSKPLPTDLPSAPEAGQGALWSARLQGNITQQVETFLNRAQAQMHLQRWQDALLSLDGALALAPEHAKAQELRSQVMLRLGRRRN